MFKNLNYLLLLLLFFSLTLEARSLLCKVSHNKATVYILGSIHLVKPEFYPLDGAIEKVYRKSDVLVVEVDVENAEAMMVMQEAMLTLGGGPTPLT